ncbi:effector-associated domain EAD1-containing protein [Nostoc sp. XA010]|uniref:VMAP-C domain-containing protein n=1 Tax=Nostoc sp. XA010 TaxID=2780407 RepID=UPI001E58C57A|nr:effector-associated domain EAD1-containing protein [Nostoc sp. XA010]MCC5659175.1 effector-associated domain EAD1-containing protein [Nostoc sp. XA010]
MNLPGPLLKEIEEALQAAFPSKEELERMLRYECDIHLDAESNRYTLILFKVIQDFERLNKLTELIRGALKANPNNIKLNEVNKKIKAIYPINDNFILNSFNEELTPILEKINFGKIKVICYKVIPELSINLPDFEINDINSLKDLFYKYSDLLSDGTLPILKFVHFLACDKTLEQSTRQKLQNWVGNTVNEYKLKIPTFFESELPQVLQAYLLIIVKPEENNNYRLNAYLIPNEEDKDNIEPLDIELAKKGILCTFDKIQEKVPEFIKKSEKHIINNTTRPWELTIEFFLPIAHLNEKVEQWQYSYDDDLDDSLLGEKCRVVVRSSDRLQRGDWIRALRFGIDRLKNVRAELNDQIIQDKFVHLTELNSFNWKSLKNTLEKDKIGLKFSCPLPVSDEKYKELFKAILISGIPIAVWKRSSISNMNPIDEFNKFLNVNSLSDCSKLFNLLLEERKLAYQEAQCENYLGYHLGVLCEEPNLEEFPDLKAAIANL